MRTLPRNHGPRPMLALVGVLLLFVSLALSPPATPDDNESEERWVSMELALRTLWTGDPAAKRATADDASHEFGPLFEAHPGRDDEAVARILAGLQSLIRTETDDFVSYRLLSALGNFDEESLTALFLEALKSRSPNLRSCGIHWFAEHTDPEALPELEASWRHEERPWVRESLMIALVENGSRNDTDDFLDLARGKDPVLAAAAFRALTRIGDPRVVPFLAKIARTTPSNSGLQALDALARWPDSPDALETVLEASRSPRLDFQRHAAQALGRFDDPAASARAYELATGRGDGYVRANALGSLQGTEPVVLTRLALQILREAPTQENAPAQSAAIATLRGLDDPSVLPDLAGLQFASDDSRFYELRWLKIFLRLPRDGSETVSNRAGEPHRSRDADVVLEEGRPEELVIAPPPDRLTVRCWEYPDVPGDPKEFSRLPAGDEVEINDHFERENESWVRIDENDCWVPLRFIEHPTGSPAGGDKEDDMLIRREFDIPAGEAESDVAEGLMDAGLLEVIDPGDEVVGVAITLDPQDFDQVLLLARSCGLNETMLDVAIDEIVQKLAPLYPERPVLDRFRRTPAARPADTDQVIDLEIRELTDQ